MAQTHRFWGVVPPLPAPLLAASVQACESMGLEGV